MNFGFSQQEESLRKEVCEFIQKEFPSELRWRFRPTFSPSIHGLDDEAWKFMRTMSRKLGAKGWLSLRSWPQEYGGRNSFFLKNIGKCTRPMQMEDKPFALLECFPASMFPLFPSR
jgi:alkylation response protein AidB-like acyl-CoA dehydrogenase